MDGLRKAFDALIEWLKKFFDDGPGSGLPVPVPH